VSCSLVLRIRRVESALVAANDQDLLAKVDQGSERVLRGGGFADAALAVESDLTKFAHVVVPFAMMMPGTDPTPLTNANE
jgi:hypothetical protein